MNKIMNKILVGAVAAMTAVAGFSGSVAPVAAEGVYSIDQSRTQTSYVKGSMESLRITVVSPTNNPSQGFVSMEIDGQPVNSTSFSTSTNDAVNPDPGPTTDPDYPTPDDPSEPTDPTEPGSGGGGTEEVGPSDPSDPSDPSGSGGEPAPDGPISSDGEVSTEGGDPSGPSGSGGTEGPEPSGTEESVPEIPGTGAVFGSHLLLKIKPAINVNQMLGSTRDGEGGEMYIDLNSSYLNTLPDGLHTAALNFGTETLNSSFLVSSSSNGGNYTPVAGDNVLSINKYLVVRSDATVPETTINFAVTPGTAIPAGNGKFEVLAGVGSPSVSSITYSASDTASKQDTVTAGDTVVLDSGMSYVKKSVYVDFSSVAFDEPGVYRYILMEASNDEATFLDMDVQAITGAVAKQRVLDVYVIDDGNGNLEVDSYVLHEILGDIAAGADMGTDVASRLSDKSDGFVNRVVTYNLEAGHEATGNQASKDKYFKYTLALSGLQPNHTYSVDLSKASEQSGSNSATIADNSNKTNPATITTDEEGAATVDYYLNDGQYIKVLGLTRNSSYTLSAAEEDYKKTAGTDAPVTETKVHDDPTSGSFATLLADQYTGYTLTRSGTIPTGVFAGAAGTLALIVFAFIFMMGKKRTVYED